RIGGDVAWEKTSPERLNRVDRPMREMRRYNYSSMFWNRISNLDDSSDIPPLDQLQGRPIGRVLTNMRKVTREQVIEALGYQTTHSRPEHRPRPLLGEVMVTLGFIQPADIIAALAAQRGERP